MIGNKQEIDLKEGILLNTPIGQLDIKYFEKDMHGNKRGLRIINNNTEIIIIPCSSNKITITCFDDEIIKGDE